MRAFLTFAFLFPTLALAESFQRPIPEAQSATAEGLFLGASIALIVSLLFVHWLVKRR